MIPHHNPNDLPKGEMPAFCPLWGMAGGVFPKTTPIPGARLVKGGQAPGMVEPVVVAQAQACQGGLCAFWANAPDDTDDDDRKDYDGAGLAESGCLVRAFLGAFVTDKSRA